ncbi:hypothetical protein [Enterobacter hormaechei]|uniref:hypothetical protein n=1 Tax=Enterobacter hormaechei TaxID=158836 RepID=UPI000751319B|nr:hypothetical protein [Enterobacter hormaechei]KUQ97947.1 hypothetical protein AWI31_04475 [Enterobacter hormaechei subsp. xiangfangensis]
MSNIDKKWLQQKIADMDVARDEIPFGLDEDDSNTLAALRIALASLEAEPVAWMWERDGKRDVDMDNPHDGVNRIGAKKAMDAGWKYSPLYTAPPASVSMKDHQIRELVNELRNIAVEYHGTQQLRERIARTVRTAMLKSFGNSEQLEPVTTAYKLRDAVEIIRNSGIEIDAEKIFAERDALNTPDCWCRTCRPITLTDTRFVVCPDCGNKRCPHANDHRNACTESNEPGQEGSAYPAAPQQEAKNV